ncbi:MAG TPA: glycosyltransferase family 39 protein [Bryobacteraceae bacterium]|nr:glycosyltransferase family 39 protein [Bryobacteraceae bacterium]
MRTAAVAAALCALFLLLGCLLVPTLGVQHDEALFAMAVWTPQYVEPCAVGSFEFPAMLMPYVGADKGYLYRPIFSVFGPNVLSLRLPVVLIGAATIAMFFALLRRFVPEWAAVAGAALLATDPMFVVTTTFDWGPLALQHLCVVAAVLLLARHPPRVLAAFVCFGLAMWDKAVAVWPLAALIASTVTLYPGEVRRALSARRLITAVAGIIVGGLPLWLYNVQNGFRTFRENTAFSTEQLFYKTHLLIDCLNGPGAMAWMLRGPRPAFITLTVPLLIVALMAGWRRRAVWFGVLAAGFIFVQMLFVRNAATGAQHTMLVWPWVHWTIACGLTAVRWKRAAVAAVAAGVLANIIMTSVYVGKGWTAGGTVGWSDAIFTAARELRPDPNEIVIAADWGLVWPLVLLTNGRLTVHVDTQEYGRNLFVSHVDGEEALAGVNAEWDRKAAVQGLRRTHVATWSDRHGRPTIIAFRYRR